MATLYLFETLGKALPRLIEQIANVRSVSTETVHQQLISYAKLNSALWRQDKPPGIPYNDPFCRLAYLYHIAPVNAQIICEAFDRSKILRDHIREAQERREEVKICAFGGGPGTELLGLAKHLTFAWDKGDPQYEISFWILDGANEWVDSWTLMTDLIKDRYREQFESKSDWPMRVSGGFCKVDFRDLESFTSLASLFDQDLYIFSYIISEVFEDFERLHEVIGHMVTHSKKEVLFLFIDRNEDRWKNAITEIAKSCNLQLSTFSTASENMPSTERMTDMGELYEQLKDSWRPRVTTKAFYALARKPQGSQK